MPQQLKRYFPILQTGQKPMTVRYLAPIIMAAVIVTIMLIPQSLAYALLAGLPPEVGLYASILPLVAYAIFGTSRVLAVGPVAVVSLMTAAALGNLALQGTTEYLIAAITLAFMSGVMLTLMGLLRLGFLANFLSHPVIAGFITASGILIATSQLKHILGVTAHGHTLPELLGSLVAHLPETNLYTVGPRRRRFGFPLLDPQRPQTAPAQSRRRSSPRGRPHQSWPRRRCCRNHVVRLCL